MALFKNKSYVTKSVGLGIVLILLIIFENCNKEKLVGEYYLTDEMRNTVPFNGNEKILFIYQNDTIELNFENKGGGIDTRYWESGKYFYYEVETTKFSGDYLLDYSLTMYKNDPRLRINWYDKNNTSAQVSFNIPLSVDKLNDGEWFLNELVVRGTTHYNVYCDSILFMFNQEEDLSDPKVFYYTEDNGVIKIDFKNGTAWELEKIEW